MHALAFRFDLSLRLHTTSSWLATQVSKPSPFHPSVSLPDRRGSSENKTPFGSRAGRTVLGASTHHTPTRRKRKKITHRTAVVAEHFQKKNMFLGYDMDVYLDHPHTFWPDHAHRAHVRYKSHQQDAGCHQIQTPTPCHHAPLTTPRAERHTSLHPTMGTVEPTHTPRIPPLQAIRLSLCGQPPFSSRRK